MKMAVCWVVAPCSLVNKDACCLHQTTLRYNPEHNKHNDNECSPLESILNQFNSFHTLKADDPLAPIKKRYQSYGKYAKLGLSL
jgi:hypothetical protein